MTTDRLLLTVATLAFGAGLSLLMLRGWRNRQRRQAGLPPLPLPGAPSDPVIGEVPGLYVGTTFADDWLDRVAVHRLAERATAWLAVRSDGVHVERDGVGLLFLPWPSIRDAAPAKALAGKVVGAGGLLLVDWVHGGRALTTGFRADDHGEHRRLAESIRGYLADHGPGPASQPVQEASSGTRRRRPVAGPHGRLR